MLTQECMLTEYHWQMCNVLAKRAWNSNHYRHFLHSFSPHNRKNSETTKTEGKIYKIFSVQCIQPNIYKINISVKISNIMRSTNFRTKLHTTEKYIVNISNKYM